MTNNQLQFQKNAETRRHNLEMEREQEFANISDRLKAQASQASAAAQGMQAQVAYTRAQEEARHNVETERQGSQTIISNSLKPIVEGGTRAVFSRFIN